MSHVHFETGILLISAKQESVMQHFLHKHSMKLDPEPICIEMLKHSK